MAAPVGTASSDLVDQRKAERMACWIAEDQTMIRIRLMIETHGASTDYAGCGLLEVLDD
jgi:hypothetical protein